MFKITSYFIFAALIIFNTGCAKQSSEQKLSEAGRQERAAVGDFSAPLRVSSANTDAAEPVMATGRDGALFVAWVEHQAKMDANVVFARLDQNGTLASAPVRVNPREGEARAWRGDPPTIASSPDGTIFVGWTGRSSAEGHATDVLLSVSRDEGRTFEPPVRVNDDKEPAVHGMHSMAVDTQGRVFLTWLDERNVKQPPPEKGKMEGHKMEANREVFTAVSTDGGRTFNANRLVAREACPCCKTSTAVASDGRLYVGWRQVLPGNYRHIAVASSADGGQTFSEPVIASDDRWMIAGCPVSGPALSTSSDGALRVLWYSGGEAGSPGLYWSESKDGGKTFSARRALAEGTAFGTPLLIAGQDGKLTAVWESNAKGEPQIVVARLDGAQAPAITQIPTRGQLPTAAATRDQVFITYINKQDEQRSIWLVRAKALA